MRAPALLVLSLALLLAAPSTTHVASASSPQPVQFASYPATGGLGASAGEPSLGIDRATGAVFLQAGSQILRVAFDDATEPASAAWTNTASGLQEEPNVDPIASVDAATGRVFAGGLEGGCSLLSTSDDDGASWVSSPDYCTIPAFDHPTVGSGPWHAPVPPVATYPRAVYYCAQGEVQECAVSWDGGLAFNPPVVITTSCTSANGHVKVAPDGAAYVPSRNCGSTQDVMVTTDNGLTWTTHAITGSTVFTRGIAGDPSVGIATDGSVYAAWLGADAHVHAARSATQGASWSAARDLGASLGVTAAEFPAVVAGDGDRAAVAFLGTTDGGDAFAQSFTGTWDLYVATTLDAGVTWTTTKVSADPVERGWICVSGTTCPMDSNFAQPGRNLLDFMDASVDARGRVVVGYADGCVDACAGPSGTVADSMSALGTIARQTCGPSLYASVGEVETGASCPTGAPPPPTPPPSFQSGSYLGPVGDVLCATPVSNCVSFAVPPGSTSVTLAIHDAISPHVAGYYCLNSCGGTTAYFCDGITLPVAASTLGITVVIDPEGAGTVACITHAPLAVEGVVTATFT